ncbi:MAG: hypothetical protein JZU49_01835 [Sulfuricurvum sp.]|nr:hypothetical protein [Sulfuricurvum sp.]
MNNKNIVLSLIIWILLTPMEGLAMANIIENIVFSSPDYQKEIIVKPLFLNKSDVIKLLNGEELATNSKIFKNDMYDFYLATCIKNIGNKGAWGTLICNVEGYGDVQIYIKHLTPNMQEFIYFVTPLSGMVMLRPIGKSHIIMDKSPTIKIEWETLQSK